MVYEFTTDDDALNDEGSTDQGTMCNLYKINLPPSANVLSRQIAKSQAKRAQKEERRRRRIDLSTVREQDESKQSASEEQCSPSPLKPSNDGLPQDESDGRSRLDAEKLRRQSSQPESERATEPMDLEEAQLLLMLLRGVENRNLWNDGSRKVSMPDQLPSNQTLPSPGLPKMLPNAKVSEWLLERSESPDALSVATSIPLDPESAMVDTHSFDDDDDDDEFFDADEEARPVNETKKENVDVVNLEHEMEGMSLNRNMTQSLVRVEEEEFPNNDISNSDEKYLKTGRSTSVSPRPSNEQFIRHSPASVSLNAKHSSTIGRLSIINGNKSTNLIRNNVNNNNNNNLNYPLTSTPISSRTPRSILRVQNVNAQKLVKNHHENGIISGSGSNGVTPTKTVANNVNGKARGMSVQSTSRKSLEAETPNSRISNDRSPSSSINFNLTTPARPSSAASNTSSMATSTHKKSSNLEGLQNLILMQEEALRKAALNQSMQEDERKLSSHSEHDIMKQSSSTHSSMVSLTSSKSADGPNSLNKIANSRIPAPRSRLPTPRASGLPKRVHSVATAVRFTTSKPQHAGNSTIGNEDECF